MNPALAEPHTPDEVLVQYRRGTPGAARSNARSAVSARAAEQLSPLARDAEVLRLAPGLSVDQAIQRLQRNPNVLYAEPNYLLTHGAVSNDPLYTNGSLWGMYGDTTTPANQFGSQAGEAWALGATGSSSVYVAVIDEGIQYTHPELAPNVWTNPFDQVDGIDNDGNGFIDDWHGWDFNGNNNSVYDGTLDDHGTHVAGTIGAQGGNAAGVAGVNWDVTIIPAKFLGDSGGTTVNAVRAVDYVTDLKNRHGLNIVASSNSWGGGSFSQGLLDAINRGGDVGILFVAAAGNSNANNDGISRYPSNYQCTTRFDTGAPRGWDCVLTVASITSTGAKSSFSSYGAVTVDLGAPGSAVWSTVPTSSYASYNGTSMATPHVSGAIALCASMGTSLSAQQLRDAVTSAAAPTASLAGITVTGGRLDIGAMITQCGATGSVLGGSNLQLQVDGPDFTWLDGNIEAGYRLYRLNTATSALNVLPAGPALPANATTFTDNTSPEEILICYFLAPVDASDAPLGIADPLCTVEGIETGDAKPEKLTLALNQSDTASLSWEAPDSEADSYVLYAFPLDGSPETTVTLGGGVTATSFNTAGQGYCFLLVGKRTGFVDGMADPACGIPGLSTLGAATAAVSGVAGLAPIDWSLARHTVTGGVARQFRTLGGATLQE